MNFERLVVLGLVALFFSTALVSGNAVPGIDLTAKPGVTSPGTGTIAVENVSIGEGALRVFRNESGTLVLQSPNVSIELGEVQKRPILNVQYRIGNLSYWDLNTYLLNGTSDGQRIVAEGETNPVPAWAATNESYEATLVVTVTDSQGNRTIYREKMVVEVENDG